MSKLQNFRIQFDKPGATYAPGETVSGKVAFFLTGSKNVREIRLEVQGDAGVRWTQKCKKRDEDGVTRKHNEVFKGEEHYFTLSNRLLGGASGANQVTLVAGQHTHSFSFQLPLNIPCSIEHSYGCIQYTAKAILDRPWKYDHKVESAFTVIAQYDLNTQASLRVGINDEIKKRFWYFCLFKSHKMKINVKSRSSGFVPGETIELVVNYDNKSPYVDVTKMKMKLQKCIKFYASTPVSKQKVSTDVIKKTKIGGPFNKVGETSLKMEVPPLPPSHLHNCSLIDVSYKLIVEICVSGMHMNETKEYPIEIGTIPLNLQILNPPQNLTAISQAPSSPIEQMGMFPQPMPHAPPMEQMVMYPQQMPPIGFFVMGERLPPSYEECISGNNQITNQKRPGMYGPHILFTQ